MKKIIIVIFSLVFLSSNASSDISLTVFLKWLEKNNVKVEDINIDKIKFINHGFLRKMSNQIMGP